MPSEETQVVQKKSVPMPKEAHLTLENMSLKLHIMRTNLKIAEAEFQSIAREIFKSQGKDEKEWSIDLDKGEFVAR